MIFFTYLISKRIKNIQPNRHFMLTVTMRRSTYTSVLLKRIYSIKVNRVTVYTNDLYRLDMYKRFEGSEETNLLSLSNCLSWLQAEREIHIYADF